MTQLSTDAEKRLDFSTLIDLRSSAVADDKNDIVDHLVDLFVKNATEVAAGIHAAESQNNREEIWRLAHRLKGSSAMLGASFLADLCQQFESKFREGVVEHSEFEAMHKNLQAEIDYVVKNLRDFASGN